MEFMKTLKSGLTNLLFSIEKMEAPADKVYNDAEVKYNKEIGSKVELIDGEGNVTEAPDGDYTMEDGTTFKVEGGFITELNGETAPEQPVEQETDKPAEEESEVTPAEDAPNPMDAINAMRDEIDTLRQAVNDLMKTMGMSATKEEVNNFSNQLNELNDTLKKLADIPAEFSKTNNNPKVNDEKARKMGELASIFKSLK